MNPILYFLPIAAVGAIFKLLLGALKNDRTVKILEVMLGVTLLLSFFQNTNQLTLQKNESSNITDETYFLKVQEEKLEEVIALAEDELAKLFIEEAETLTGTRPCECIVNLENEEFSIQTIDFTFPQNVFISSYEVKSHFKEKYNVDVSVYME